MKPGDKVWVWNAWGEKKHQIEQGILVSTVPGCVDAWVQMPQFRARPYHFLREEVFPTREALCEHYRKIFE